MLPEVGLGKAVVGVIARKVIEAGTQSITNQLTATEVEKALVNAIDEAQALGELVPSLNLQNPL
ncbi:hypothetical protein C1752_01164 [Acaryochloris thomasi RCC1774]|uniref:Uncharacterized protein n=1 Tax=Acaryochloris thomasi RCC1774 TaxID=1764569 RepID=A0A2W1JY09_9CYAN|nr:hypothetical protein [Acaryochloris thomasi]PZD74434.1 hypothetical protein C1752_01164 [Acaryochloris thomasi RCC1774]